MEIDVTLKDKLKSIVDKETAFNNAIKDFSYPKVKDVLEKNPEMLLPKHLKLIEALVYKQGISQEQLDSLSLIGKEINYTADKNFANYYAYSNNLTFENSNVALRTELNSDPPCNKEPLIHYISKGADITMLNNENLDKKLQDIGFTEIGGIKVLEQDKNDLINFATITAIKNDDLGAFKHLEKEFNITNPNLDLNQTKTSELAVYAQLNKASNIEGYLNDMYMSNVLKGENHKQTNSGLENTHKNDIKLNSVIESKNLISAIEQKDYSKIEKAILNGASINNFKLNESIKKHDSEDQKHIIMTIYNSSKERNLKIPEELRYKFDFKETLKLQEAAVKGNAIDAYNAIKNGADPKGITKNHYTHLPTDVKKTFENAVFKAYTEQTKNTISKTNNNSLSI